SLRAAFDYALVNLEGQDGWSLQGLSEFNNMLSPALDSLKDGGTLFLSLPATKCREALLFLRTSGSFETKIHDPFGNGLCLLEVATAGGSLADERDCDWAAYKKCGFFRPPLLDSKWVRLNDIPFFAQDARDQDWQKIQSVKKIQVDLLKTLAQVCQSHGLKLYPIYGTLLGLMRGGSFIDGDDDIDVGLPREDYDKLLSLGAEFSGKYFLQTTQSDDCFFGGYAKLRNVQTTAIHPQNWWAGCCEGISIDIFPIDKTFSKPADEKRKLKKLRFYQRLLYAYSSGILRDFADMRLLKWKSYKYLGKLLKRKEIASAFDSCAASGDSTTKLSIYTHYRNGSLDGNIYFDAADFAKTVKMNFEGVVLDVPCGWKSLLEKRYGQDFLCPPGVNERKMRHGFYDTNAPYGVWKARFGGLKNPGRIKEPVVLFGDGALFSACLSYYKSRVNIPYLVLLPGEEKTAKKICGVPVLSFDEFKKLGLERGSYRGVICSGDVLAADALLSQNGLNGLYVFWHDR
ncbi:MAG: LicD family protein, partial [Opitutales bacterium]|nr:LicD family protein [Opitutales bacterium]